MSTVSPPSRSELLRELASMLLDDQIEGTLAVALAGYTDDGVIDLSVRPLPSIDPISALYGFQCPRRVARIRCRHVRDGASPRRP